MALGIGFSECIKGGIDMDKKELFEKGVNDSLVAPHFLISKKDFYYNYVKGVIIGSRLSFLLNNSSNSVHFVVIIVLLK